MNAHFETGGTYPLSSEPAEGYISDPKERDGKVVLVNALNSKFIQLHEGGGFEYVSDRAAATKFDNHSEAAVTAGRLVAAARETKKAA
jgi:hypothetical protein